MSRNNLAEVAHNLGRYGISYDDAVDLRRIAMTLHRWYELECGDGNDYYSFAIVRGHKKGNTFEQDDTGKPYMERHENRPTRADGNCRAYWTLLPDRERGAEKRLAAIMARYPALAAYRQTDPRGASLYIYERAALDRYAERVGGKPVSIDSCYSSIGCAVYQ